MGMGSCKGQSNIYFGLTLTTCFCAQKYIWVKENKADAKILSCNVTALCTILELRNFMLQPAASLSQTFYSFSLC